MCVFKNIDQKKNVKRPKKTAHSEEQVKHLIRCIRNNSVKAVEQQLQDTETKAKAVNLEFCTHKTLRVCLRVYARADVCAHACVWVEVHTLLHTCAGQRDSSSSVLTFYCLSKGLSAVHC